jgi:hypothetical protein
MMHTFLNALDVEECFKTVIHLYNRSNWWCNLLQACMPMCASAMSLNTAVTNLELLKAKVKAMGQRNVR